MRLPTGLDHSSGQSGTAVSGRGCRGRLIGWSPFLLLILLLALIAPPVSALAQPTSGSGQQEPLAGAGQANSDDPEPIPPKPAEFDRVYDLPGQLNQDQYDRFHFDIGRLWNHGLPAMIYIRESLEDEAQSQAFADGLRDTWDIESAPGADDGLVLLVTIRPRFPHTAILSVSYGANTFPTGQMTTEVLERVVDREATPRIRVGNVNGGLTYALRRVIYYTEYTAPFPEPRTRFEDALRWVAIPVNALLIAAFAYGSWLAIRQRPSWMTGRNRWYVLAGAGTATLAGAALAVLARSNAATATAFIAMIVLGVFALVLGRGRSARPARRVLRVNTPRVRRPAPRQAARRA